jgi:hypothetical protein
MKHTGSCLCGEITFEVDGYFEDFYLCHCKRCRKDTGSAHAANLFSSTAKLRWLSGEDKVKTFKFKATSHIKSFCLNCGSALPNIQMDGALVVVPAGCLDSEVAIKPQGHIFIESSANWDNGLEKVAKFDELPQ